MNKKCRKMFLPQEDRRLVDLRVEGRSLTDIGKILGRNPGSVLGRLRRLAEIEDEWETKRGSYTIRRVAWLLQSC